MSRKVIRPLLASANTLSSAHTNTLAIFAQRGPASRCVWRLFSAEKTATQQNAETLASDSKDTEAKGASSSTTTETNLAEEVVRLTEKVKSLTQKNDDLLDKYKRSLAEGENLRVRLTKQIADAKIFGIQSFCKDLLEVADTLGHATEAVPKDEVNDDNPHLKNLYEGLTMTQASLQQVFKRHGLEVVNPLTEKFNPNLHEALFTLKDDTVEPNTVVAVTKMGYKLRERCIRPAMVGVSQKS